MNQQNGSANCTTGKRNQLLCFWLSIFLIAYAIHVSALLLVSKDFAMDLTNLLTVIIGTIWVLIWSICKCNNFLCLSSAATGEEAGKGKPVGGGDDELAEQLLNHNEEQATDVEDMSAVPLDFSITTPTNAPDAAIVNPRRYFFLDSLKTFGGGDDELAEQLLNHNEEQATDVEDMSAVPLDFSITTPTNAPDAAIVNPRRYFFLDNLKTFLTASVVSFHVVSSFNSPKDMELFIGIGDDSDGVKNAAVKVILGLLRAFFMTLFFLISGFFAVSTHKRKGRTAFIQTKTKRVLVPAVVYSYTINPLVMLIKALTEGNDIVYLPSPGVTWYLYFLFLFCVMFSTLRKESDQNQISPLQVEDDSLSLSNDDLPSTKSRFFYGFFVCGVGMFLVSIALMSTWFYSMPIKIGSLVNNIFMFFVGVIAWEKNWFDGRAIADRLDVSSLFLGMTVFAESCVLGLLIAAFDDESFAISFCIYVLAGLYNVDMNTILLSFFQTNFNEATVLSKKLSKASYAVYLIHQLVI
mmetsp:Transcript_6235/g.9100  ORF Transcript_6235/g.9100 Transcript_6235/m.9100 type:complete len:522 (-) Transcript_6235:281-1846(-)